MGTLRLLLLQMQCVISHENALSDALRDTLGTVDLGVGNQLYTPAVIKKELVTNFTRLP